MSNGLYDFATLKYNIVDDYEGVTTSEVTLSWRRRDDCDRLRHDDDSDYDCCDVAMTSRQRDETDGLARGPLASIQHVFVKLMCSALHCVCV